MSPSKTCKHCGKVINAMNDKQLESNFISHLTHKHMDLITIMEKDGKGGFLPVK